MGLFNLKKRSKDKTPSLSIPPSPSFSSFSLGRRSAPSSPAMHEQPSPLASPVVQQPDVVVVAAPAIAARPTTKLNVVLDPLPRGTGLPEAASGIIQISVEDDADIDEVAYEIKRALKLPRGVSIGCYKVAIPIDAHHSSKKFIDRNPETPVHLVSHFPSYNLSDHTQLGPSLQSSSPCQSRCSQESHRDDKSTTVHDWWPHPREVKEDEIQVLVRLGEAEEDLAPLTLLVHFARPASSSSGSTSRRSPSPSPVLPHQRPRHTRGPSTSSLYSPTLEQEEIPHPPIALDVRRDARVEDVLDDLVRADGRPGGVERLREKIILWRVDMSWKEMLNCERFGGLRTGDMPWPYPPNAPEPVAITDYSKPISHTFPAHTSNLNLVSLFVYIKPEAQRELARISSSSSSSVETFVYPPRPAVLPHQHHSSPSIPTSGSMAGGEEVAEGESSLKMERRRRRGASSRPSTAPSLGSSSGFGFSSPLASSSTSSGASASTTGIPAFGRPRKTGYNSTVCAETQDNLPLGQSPLELDSGVHLRARTMTSRPRSMFGGRRHEDDDEDESERPTRSTSRGFHGLKMKLNLEALRRLDLDTNGEKQEVLSDEHEPELVSSSSASARTGSISMPPTPQYELAGTDFGMPGGKEGLVLGDRRGRELRMWG